MGLMAMRMLVKFSGVTALAVMASAPLVAQGQSKQANLRVTAEVVQNCLVTTADVAFGNYDPVGTNASAPLDAVGTITLTCTQGTHTLIALDFGQNSQGRRRQMANGAARLGYEVYLDVARQIPWNSPLAMGAAPSLAPRAFSVYGRVAQGQNVAAGTYADTIVVTVTY